jgi:hypothetical protein
MSSSNGEGPWIICMPLNVLSDYHIFFAGRSRNSVDVLAKAQCSINETSLHAPLPISNNFVPVTPSLRISDLPLMSPLD